jgi:hypothetical protein
MRTTQCSLESCTTQIWASISYDQLQARMKQQQERAQRLPTPTWEEVATQFVWNLVCMGYVP